MEDYNIENNKVALIKIISKSMILQKILQR